MWRNVDFNRKLIPFQDGQSSMSLLAARQDIILEKLHDLKEQLVTMKNNSRVCFKPPQNEIKSTGGKGKKSEGKTGGPPQGRCQAKVSCDWKRSFSSQLTHSVPFTGQCP